MKWLIFFLLWGCSSYRLESQKEAEKSAIKWFSYLDNNYFVKAFLESSPHLRQRLNRSRMEELLTKRLMLVGKIKIRTKASVQVLKNYRGLGAGEFINIDYLSDFELRSGVNERVILKLDGASWKVFDYFFF